MSVRERFRSLNSLIMALRSENGEFRLCKRLSLRRIKMQGSSLPDCREFEVLREVAVPPVRKEAPLKEEPLLEAAISAQDTCLDAGGPGCLRADARGAGGDLKKDAVGDLLVGVSSELISRIGA